MKVLQGKMKLKCLWISVKNPEKNIFIFWITEFTHYIIKYNDSGPKPVPKKFTNDRVSFLVRELFVGGLEFY